MSNVKVKAKGKGKGRQVWPRVQTLKNPKFETLNPTPLALRWTGPKQIRISTAQMTKQTAENVAE
jgi:hypothetical protein